MFVNRVSGIRNTVTTEALLPTREGVYPLANAVNVDIDVEGKVRRRRGYAQLQPGDWHSLYTSGGVTHAVRDQRLVRVFPDGTWADLGFTAGADPLSYTTVAESVYFSSRTTSGVIVNGAVAPWGEQVSPGQWLSPVVNPTVNLPEVGGKLLGKPPVAEHICYFNGRIYLANDRVLWATELYLYGLVDKTKNYKYFEDEITFTGAVTDGIYVGTQGGVYFLAGPLHEMQRVKVSDSPGLKSSLVHEVNPDFIGSDTPSKNAVLFMTEAGVYAGLDGGMCLNLTKSDMIFPHSDRVSPVFREQDGVRQYVAVAQGSGSPASSARFGDYVDAEIRRFKGA
jgi:hypothetical protein